MGSSILLPTAGQFNPSAVYPDAKHLHTCPPAAYRSARIQLSSAAGLSNGTRSACILYNIHAQRPQIVQPGANRRLQAGPAYTTITAHIHAHRPCNSDGREALSHGLVLGPFIWTGTARSPSYDQARGPFIWTGGRPFHKARCEALSYGKVQGIFI